MDPITQVTVEIPVDDLNILRAAISSAYHFSTVIDLQEQYRKLQQRPTQSKMTQALHNALTLVLAYIEAAEEPTVPEEDSDD